MQVSCVIVAYHRPAHISRLLDGLHDARLEVVVVNVEDDVRLRALECDRVVATVSNRGYAAGVNAGVAAATGDIVVFMNDDVETAVPDVLCLADRIASGHADVSIPLVLDRNGNFELGNRLPLGLARRMLLNGGAIPEHPLPVDAAWAPMVAVRRDLIAAVPVPEDYFMYWEEFDWFHQLRSTGVRIEVNPSARIRHEGSPNRPEKSRLLARNAVRCVRRIRGRWAALRAWPVVVMWQLQQLAVTALNRRGRAPLVAHAAGFVAAVAAWEEIWA
jgi:GT2 family glycosyltransferase